MRRIALVALNTFREAVREKILHNVVALSVALLLFSLVLGDWSVFDRDGVVKSFGISIASISALVLSIFVGIQLLQREIQRRTLFALLAKPIHRWQFVLGKWIGLMMVLGAHLLLMLSAVDLILWLINAEPGWNLLQAALMIWFEMGILSAAAVLFSTFSSPTLSSLFTAGVYVAGHLISELDAHIEFTKAMGSFGRMPAAAQWCVEKGAKLFDLFFPDLERFNVSTTVIHGVAGAQSAHYADLATVLSSAAYSCSWCALLLAVAALWFSKRDFI